MSQSYAKFIPEIEKSLKADLITVLERVDPELVTGVGAQLRIGEVKDFGSMASDSQRLGIAIWESKFGNELVRRDARNSFMTFASAVANGAKLQESRDERL
jgi:hypothetical protein